MFISHSMVYMKISKSPFFYIMLPTFNRPELVLRSVRSVLEQAYSDYKLVIFNDGSTTNYAELESLIEGKDHIEYIKSDNIGINKSRNLMLESFLKNKNIDNAYFFTLSDDDYLKENSLSIIAEEIIKKPAVWYCFNCLSNSQHIYNNSDYVDYNVLKYSDFSKNYKGDKHFVFKLEKFTRIRYASKYFKNGYEHLFYYQIPYKIQIIPMTVKVIEYYDDGLSLSDLYDDMSTFNIKIKELRSIPFNWLLYKKFIIFYLKPKNIIKNLISEDIYYKIKVKFGFKDKKNKRN
ncbi:glycosyltransferase family 2 protein [Acinetobacter portensis]|uniref:glycosyltransferase family 2 protein n=2 Tax=Acinetobacter portensis TaxID=1839785 RepID=UPI00128D8AC9